MNYLTILLLLLTQLKIGHAQVTQPVNFQFSIGGGAGLILPDNQKLQDGLFQISLNLYA